MKLSENLQISRQTSLPGQSQRGATLIIALVMLLLISILAIGGMQGSVMQERMASNSQDQTISFQAAETALRQGEDNLMNNTAVKQNALQTALLQNPVAWDGANPAASGTGDAGDQVNTEPVFHLASLGEVCFPNPNVPCFERFNVTSRAEGGSGQAITILQTTISLP
mgnify:CR=1 FL=1